MIWHVGQFVGQYHSLAISFLNTDPDITARILHAPSHTKLDAISGSTYVRHKDFDTYIPSKMLSIHGGPCALTSVDFRRNTHLSGAHATWHVAAASEHHQWSLSLFLATACKSRDNPHRSSNTENSPKQHHTKRLAEVDEGRLKGYLTF